MLVLRNGTETMLTTDERVRIASVSEGVPLGISTKERLFSYGKNRPKQGLLLSKRMEVEMKSESNKTVMLCKMEFASWDRHR